MEFQTVIMAAGRGTRMGCVTEGIPKALLPLGNRPLLFYPARLLEKWGVEEAILVVPELHTATFTAAAAQLGVSIKFEIVAIKEDDDLGTADSLRAIAPRLRGDVLVVSCDLICDVSLQAFADKHRRHDSSATVLLTPSVTAYPDLEPSKEESVLGQQLIVGLDSNDRLMLVSDGGDLENDELSLRMCMMCKHPNIYLHMDLFDAHMYILKKWVVDYIAKDTSIQSLQGELLPLLVENQFTKPRHSPTLPSCASVQEEESGTQCVRDSLTSAHTPHAFVSRDHWYEDVLQISSTPTELVDCNSYSCYAYVQSQGVCLRTHTLPLYSDASKSIRQKLASMTGEATVRMKKSAVMKEKSQACADSMIDDDCMIGERCSIKKSTIGKHCKISDKVRITNSIIMDHVTICEGCTLHNVIICPNSYIHERCSLKDCQVAKHVTVPANTTSKGESFSGGQGDL